MSQQLKELIAAGLVSKREWDSKIPHTEYGITPYGASVRPVLDALCDWGESHLERSSVQRQADPPPAGI
jgi:DNA-binding HxlR family transcriptional regulator